MITLAARRFARRERDREGGLLPASGQVMSGKAVVLGTFILAIGVASVGCSVPAEEQEQGEASSSMSRAPSADGEQSGGEANGGGNVEECISPVCKGEECYENASALSLFSYYSQAIRCCEALYEDMGRHPVALCLEGARRASSRSR